MAKHVIDAGFKQSVEREVRENILNFWIEHTLDEEQGGFYGKITHSMDIEASAPKGLVLNTRILWSFSRAYNYFNAAEYLTVATRAYNYLVVSREDFNAIPSPLFSAAMNCARQLHSLLLLPLFPFLPSSLVH